MSPISSTDEVDETSSLLPHSSHNEATQQHTPNSGKISTALAFKVAAAMYSFAILGLFTSTIGAILPSISKHYSLSKLRVSFIFLVGPLGYVLASQSNVIFHTRFGQMGVATLGPLLHILSAGIIATHPPFAVVLVAFAFAAAGNALLDGSWCAWAASMKSANTVSGLLHGSFSVGAATGPFLVGTLLAKEGREWYEWYYLLAAASVVELVVLIAAFKNEIPLRTHGAVDETISLSSYKNDFYAILSHRATWISAAYFLAYVGTETAISGWIVFFMGLARHATPYQAVLASTAFWSGMTVGRFCLGPVTDRAGVIMATTGYLLVALVFEVLFAAIRVRVVGIALMTLLGFIMGPLFPSGVVLLTRHLPKALHIQAVSFVASVGQVGGAILPFGIGALMDGLGIGVFQYALLLFTGVTLVLWVTFARLRPTTTGARFEERVQVSD